MRILLKIILILFVVLVAGYWLLAKTTYLDFVKNWGVFRVCCINDEILTADSGNTGVIEGFLSYPSESIPPMRVCAEDINTKKQYCTTEHIKNSKYKYGEGYKVSVPAGRYYVFATTEAVGNYRAYHSQNQCGESSSDSHNPILVEISPGTTVTSVNPCDWYK